MSFTIKGKFCEMNVYATTVEDEAISQLYTFANNPVTEGCHVAIMPDVHSGKGVTIGFTQMINKENPRINPNMVGVDIGCGMLVLKISAEAGKILFNKPGLEKFDKIMHTKVPSGMAHRETLHKFAKDFTEIKNLIADADYDKELFAMGSLGGGNHFVEIDTDEKGDYYIVIHSGSRHLGIAVAKYWEDRAIKHLKDISNVKNELISRLKKEGREKDIQTELAKLPAVIVSKDLSYLEGADVDGYLHDMKICQEFARLNREAMLDVLIEEMGIKKRHILDKFCTIHNYIDIENGILRKGAISLQKDESAIIPVNMQYGSLIVKGKGNPDWNFSGPHGAGRLMSRSKAKETLKMEDFKNAMKDIYTTSVCVSTIDEAPMAYKSADEILENIKENAEVISIIKPIYNFKSVE